MIALSQVSGIESPAVAAPVADARPWDKGNGRFEHTLDTAIYCFNEAVGQNMANNPGLEQGSAVRMVLGTEFPNKLASQITSGPAEVGAFDTYLRGQRDAYPKPERAPRESRPQGAPPRPSITLDGAKERFANSVASYHGVVANELLRNESRWDAADKAAIEKLILLTLGGAATKRFIDQGLSAIEANTKGYAQAEAIVANARGFRGNPRPQAAHPKGKRPQGRGFGNKGNNNAAPARRDVGPKVVLTQLQKDVAALEELNLQAKDESLQDALKPKIEELELRVAEARKTDAKRALGDKKSRKLANRAARAAALANAPAAAAAADAGES